MFCKKVFLRSDLYVQLLDPLDLINYRSVGKNVTRFGPLASFSSPWFVEAGFTKTSHYKLPRGFWVFVWHLYTSQCQPEIKGGYFGKVFSNLNPPPLFLLYSWFDLQEAFKRSSKLYIGTVVDVHVSHWITTKSYIQQAMAFWFESYHTIAICLSRSNSCFISQMHFLTLPPTEFQLD